MFQKKRLSKSDKTIGIDVGIKSFCVDSDGNKADNPLYLKQVFRILKKKQRVLNSRKKGSSRRNKARLIVAKTHEKITNQRNDFLHKLANKYIQENGLICVEDLNIEQMVSNKYFSQLVADSSWGKFFRLLEYKAEEAGRTVVKVPPNNTSQICSGCGEKVPKTLAVRIHCCPHCGLVMDRDENAARNIAVVGQTAQELTYAVA